MITVSAILLTNVESVMVMTAPAQGVLILTPLTMVAMIVKFRHVMMKLLLMMKVVFMPLKNSIIISPKCRHFIL